MRTGESVVCPHCRAEQKDPRADGLCRRCVVRTAIVASGSDPLPRGLFAEVQRASAARGFEAARTLRRLGERLVALGCFQEAEPLLERSTAILENLRVVPSAIADEVSRSRRLAKILEDSAVVLRRIGCEVDAATLEARARTLREDLQESLVTG